MLYSVLSNSTQSCNYCISTHTSHVEGSQPCINFNCVIFWIPSCHNKELECVHSWHQMVPTLNDGQIPNTIQHCEREESIVHGRWEGIHGSRMHAEFLAEERVSLEQTVETLVMWDRCRKLFSETIDERMVKCSEIKKYKELLLKRKEFVPHNACFSILNLLNFKCTLLKRRILVTLGRP